MGCPGLIPQVDIPLLIIPNQSAPPAASAEQIHNASSACGSGCNCSQLEFLLPDPYEPVYYSLIDDQDISSEMNSLFTVEETNFLLEALFQIGMVCCGYTREKSKRRKVYYAKVLPEICEHTLGSVASVYNTVSFSFTLMCMNFFDFSSIYNSLNFLSSPVRNIVYYFLKTIMLNIWCVLMLDVPYEFVSSWFHFTQITTIGFLLLQGLNVVFFKHTGHYGLPFVTNFGATILYVGILAPILEEYAKHHYMSMPILFGLFEALECKKRHLGPIKWSPVLLHGFVYKLESLNLRIFIHIIWNLSQVLVFLWKDHRNNYETFKHDWVYMKFISVFDLLFLRFHRRLNPPGATPLPASLGAAINLGDDVELVDAIPSFRPDSKFIFDNFTTCKTAIQSFLMDQFIGLYAPFPGIRLKDIERYFTFLLNLCMQSTTTSMITTVMQFASSTSNKLLIEQFKSLLSAFPVPSGWKPESKFKKVSDDIDWLLDTAGSFSGSQMYQWTRAVVTGCLLIPFFNKLNLKFHAKRFGAYDQSFLRSANDNKISFVVDVIRSFKNIIESGVGFITGNGDLNLFKSSTPFSTFFEQADFLYKMQNFLTAGATTKHFLNNEEFRTQLLNTISDGRRIVAATKSCDPGVRTLIARKLAILDDMETKLLVADLAADKDPAMIVVTVGAPGVGKSVFAKMTQQVLEKAYDREFDASAVAVVNPDSKFQDHITNGTRIIHIEELGIETYDALNAKDNTTRMLLYYGDSNPQIVEKSHVDDKGRTLNRNDFVTANTNSFNINVQHITKFPAAVYRRIHWQEIVCKEEFRAEGSLGPDHNKIAAAGVSSLDVYMVREVTFDTTKPVMVFDKRGEPTDIKRGEWMSTDEWSKWLTDKAKTFRDKQKGRRKAYSELMDSRCPHNSWIAICETCKTTAEFKPESRTPVPHLPIEFSSYLFFLYFCKLIFSISSLGALSFFLPLTWFSAHWLNCIAYWLFAFFSKRFFRARYDALWLRLVTNVTTSWDHICDMWIGKISVEKLNDRLVDAANQSSVTMQRLTRTVAFVDMAIAIISCSAGYYILKSVISWFKSYSGTPQGNASSRPAKAEHQTSYESFGSDLAKMGVNTRRMKPTATSAKNVWQEAHSMRAVIEESHMHPPEHLQSVLARQTYKCLLVTDAEESDFNAIAVAPEFLLTNKHNLRPKGRLTISLSMLAEDQQKLCRSYTVDICQDHICDLGGDRALIYVPSLQCKSLLKWMAKDYHKDGWFFSQRSPGFIYDELPRDISVTFGTNENFFGTLMEQVLYYDYEEHRSGLCGAPICFTIGAGTFLYGFHCAGAQDDRCMAVAFTRKDIQRGMDTLKPQRKLAPLVPEGEIKYFDVSGSPPLLGTPDSKSFLNWQSGFVDYVGTVKNLTYTRPRPNMYYLPTAEFAENFGVDTKNSDGNYKWGIPVFKEFPDATEDLGYYSPYHKWASKSFQSSDYCDYEAVTSAMEEFWENIENADVDWDVRPMDIDSVCAGDNQVHTVRSMNAKTSMGFGFKGKKSDYMYENCTDQAPDGKMLSDDILSSVMEDIKTYASGKTVCPISKASLKVEARVRQPSGDEFKTKQPRVFCATPISDVVIGRMFLLPLLDIMKQDRKHFECAVGLNAMSPQWGTLRDIFEEKDVINKTFGTDISGFDTRMPLLVKHAAMTILIRMAIKCGWSSEEIAIITGYLTDGLYPYVLVKNDILLMPNIIISGRVGTAEFNSLCLSIIYRMVWNKLRVKIQPDLKFNDNVALITYGDDSKAGSLADWFNQRNFCLGCAYFGIHATTVSKSEDFEQFVPFDGEEFLHRIWRWDEEYQVWCAPLAFDSMVRSLVLNNTSPIGPDVQCFEAAHSINFELAQHGREVFNEKMPKLYGILLDAGIIGRVGEPTFKSFEEIMERCYR
jgi:hypothetical protein